MGTKYGPVYEDDAADLGRGIPEQTDEEAANEAAMNSPAARARRKISDVENEEAPAAKMPTRPGQASSGSKTPDLGNEGRRTSMAIAPAAKKPVAKQKPNFDPALRSSESVGNSQLSTLNKQLQKAPENAGRMAARQALEKKAMATAKSQAIIDRMSRRTKPYMTDEAGNSMKRGGAVKKMASGGTASSRGDGIAQRGKTRGKMC